LALLATAVGAAIGGTASLLGGALELGNLTKSEGAGSSLQEQVKNLFPQAGPVLAPTGRSENGQRPNEQGSQPPTDQGAQPPGKLTELAQKDPQLSSALAEMEKKGGASKATEDRDKIVGTLTSQYQMDQQEAANLVQQWDQDFQRAKSQTEQKAADVGAAATHGVASGALWGFIALLLGLIFSAWGGWVGTASVRTYVEPARAT
jgi:hypothetical protein